MVVRERRRQQHDRGWALMEAFFVGAIILYATVHKKNFFFKNFHFFTAPARLANACAMELLDGDVWASARVYPLLRIGAPQNLQAKKFRSLGFGKIILCVPILETCKNIGYARRNM